MPDNPAPVVSFYAALLAFMYVGLSVYTLRLRRRLKIAIGDAGNPAMLRAVRVHSNFAEYVPLGLVLTLLVETGGGPPLLLHFLGLCLLAGRVIHAAGVSRAKEDYRFRVTGMSLTFACLLAAAGYLLYTALPGIAA